MTVVVTSGGIKKTISISQQGRSTTAGEYHYNLPVIFHVLYKDKNNPLQYVKQDRLAKILDTVNKLYKDKTKSVDMNLTFTLATTDEDGKPLSTPGVEYVSWEESYPIDCDAFMNDETEKYVKYIWEPRYYINVMVYNEQYHTGNCTYTFFHSRKQLSGRTEQNTKILFRETKSEISIQCLHQQFIH